MKKKKPKIENMVVNDIKISETSKQWLVERRRIYEIRKDRSLRFQLIKWIKKVDKNGAILGQPWFQFLAIRLVSNAEILGQLRFQFAAIKVVRNVPILGQPDTFERKHIEFHSWTMWCEM